MQLESNSDTMDTLLTDARLDLRPCPRKIVTPSMVPPCVVNISTALRSETVDDSYHSCPTVCTLYSTSSAVPSLRPSDLI